MAIKNEAEFNAALEQVARAAAKDITKHAKEYMQANVEEYLYNQDLVHTHESHYENTRAFAHSIRGNTVKSKEQYLSLIFFDRDTIFRAHHKLYTIRVAGKRGARSKKKYMFGAYTTVSPDERFFPRTASMYGRKGINAEFLEEGTDYPSLVPRKGAHMIAYTKDDIEKYIGSGGFAAHIKQTVGGLKIVRK